MPSLNVRRLAANSRVRSISLVLIGNATNNLVAFAISALAAREMGPASFGVLGVGLAIAITGGFLLDFGLDIALVRAYKRQTDDAGIKSLIFNIVAWKLILLALTVLLCVPFATLVSHVLKAVQSSDAVFAASILSAGLFSLWRTLRAIEQAKEKFTSLVAYVAVYATLRVAGGVWLLLTRNFSPVAVLAVLYLFPLGLLTLPSAFRVLVSNSARLSRQVLWPAFAYSKWVALSGVAFIALLRVPQFVLAGSATSREVGILSAGILFVGIFSLLNDATRVVLVPEAASLALVEDRSKFRGRVLSMLPLFVALTVVVILAVVSVQRFVLGERFGASVSVFVILAIGTAFSMYVGFFNTLVHSVGVPRLEAAVNGCRLVALIILAFLAPKTAFTSAALYAVVLGVGEVALLLRLRRLDGAIG